MFLSIHFFHFFTYTFVKLQEWNTKFFLETLWSKNAIKTYIGNNIGLAEVTQILMIVLGKNSL